MTSAVSTANRLDNLASIIKAKKEQERAEYDALPEVVIDCAVHGEQHVKLMPGQEADQIECPLCVQERQRYFFLARIGVIEGGGIHERGDAPRPRLIRVGAVFEQGVHQRQPFFRGGIHIEA